MNFYYDDEADGEHDDDDDAAADDDAGDDDADDDADDGAAAAAAADDDDDDDANGDEMRMRLGTGMRMITKYLSCSFLFKVFTWSGAGCHIQTGHRLGSRERGVVTVISGEGKLPPTCLK